MSLTKDIIESWADTTGKVYSTEYLLQWITELNESTYVNIKECSVLDSAFWFYDDYNGEISNRKRCFFSVKGMRRFKNDEFAGEQPIIFQPEIGYLGIICKKIEGVLHFLMQAKIEPGNINCVQISPTIQATKSNFTRAHGGKLPTYFEYFENSSKYQILYDQIQSEQASRFYKKRNRNMIMLLEEDIPEYSNYKWMTLGQIKSLMEVDNLVNMDTRTVLSGIPFVTEKLSESEEEEVEKLFRDKALFQSVFQTPPSKELSNVFRLIDDYKMFTDIKAVAVPVNQLVDWKVDEYGVTCKKDANFMVRYYDIEIEGREVQHWTQPLFKATGMATFALITKVDNGARKFLVKLSDEIGTFDKVELGPAIQWEPTHKIDQDNAVDRLFREKIEKKEGILCSVILSEEGGRFYHEQNYNYILEVEADEVSAVPAEYMWVSFSTLNYMVQINNCLNIQLRNLLSLLKL